MTEQSDGLIRLDEEMRLNHPLFDQTHEEFLNLLHELNKAPAEKLLPILDELIAHTEAHFGMEESWMARLNFPAAGCHINEHNQVIGVMRLVRQRVSAGEVDLAFVLATELLAWLRIHATTMDYALTHFMEATGAEL